MTMMSNRHTLCTWEPNNDQDWPIGFRGVHDQQLNCARARQTDIGRSGEGVHTATRPKIETDSVTHCAANTEAASPASEAGLQTARRDANAAPTPRGDQSVRNPRPVSTSL
jgi:hypothetical protein